MSEEIWSDDDESDATRLSAQMLSDELDYQLGEIYGLPRPRCKCGKARYATEGEARRAVKRMKSNGRDHSYAGLLHPYMCPERKGIWHVGHTDE